MVHVTENSRIPAALARLIQRLDGQHSATAPMRPEFNDPDGENWIRQRAGRSDLRNDMIGAIALWLGSVLSMTLFRTAAFYPEPAPLPLSLLLLAAATLPLAFRRRWPIPVAMVVAAAFILVGTYRVPEVLVVNIALFVAVYTVGSWENNRSWAALSRLVVIAAMLVWLLIALFIAATDIKDDQANIAAGAIMSPFVAYMLIQILTNLLYFGGAYFFGDHAFEAARERARAEVRTTELTEQRAITAQQAITLERLRIARELHDAVAHHVSVMGVQASAARTVLDSDPEAARSALTVVETGARTAIDELHSLLGTLREPHPEGSEDTVGSFGVRHIPDLIESARANDLSVIYAVVGDPRPLPPLTSLNLYRITQESLTNVRKHGGQHASVDVRLRYLPRAVELDIANTGDEASASAARTVRSRRRTRHSSGLGIVGMRERVDSDGGTLHAGLRERGGFLVRAHIPLQHVPHEQRDHPNIPHTTHKDPS
ncbi:sensor histidine kinase [Klugiella xanthotipulae]